MKRLRDLLNCLQSKAGCIARLFLAAFILLGISVSAQVVFEAETDEEPPPNRYIILAEEAIEDDVGRVFVFFADLTLEEGVVAGNIYAFFSRVYIADSVRLKGTIYAFSSDIFGFYSSMVIIPSYIIQLSFVLLGLLMCFAVFAAFRGFVSQGGLLLGAEPGKAIRNGILAYFLAIGLVVILSLTIVLLPIALLFVIAGLILIIFGQASMSLLIGLALSRRLDKSFSPAVCMLIGLGALAVISNIPYIGAGVSYIFMPILSMGITVTCIINGFIKKKFYYAPFKREDEPKKFDRAAVRDIIMGEEKP